MNCFQSNVALSDLNLPSNKISDSGATALAATLRENSALTHLSLDDNVIGDAGAVALAEALEVCHTLCNPPFRQILSVFSIYLCIFFNLDYIFDLLAFRSIVF